MPWSEFVISAAKHKPDVMITCIDGGFNNLSHFEAAALADAVKPRAVIPAHYDMVPDNSLDARQF